MDDKTKLKKLLEHWMEHNEEHSQEFSEWAKKAKLLGSGDAAESIAGAVKKLEEANAFLKKALGSLK